jgi:hypothetical protein
MLVRRLNLPENGSSEREISGLEEDLLTLATRHGYALHDLLPDLKESPITL